jgi:hypothetical protein
LAGLLHLDFRAPEVMAVLRSGKEVPGNGRGAGYRDERAECDHPAIETGRTGTAPMSQETTEEEAHAHDRYPAFEKNRRATVRPAICLDVDACRQVTSF